MLLTCRRDNSATAQPRAGVRMNPAESAAEVSMQSSLYCAGTACQGRTFCGQMCYDVTYPHTSKHDLSSWYIARGIQDGEEILTMVPRGAPPKARDITATLTAAAIYLTLATE